ncbi:MAG TPA: hypothetical protein VGE06_07115, partial [Flavisolibacter sp.]
MNVFHRYTKTCLAFLLLTVCFACQKPVQTANNTVVAASTATHRTTAAATTAITAPAICDYTFNGQALLDGGWTKYFEDNFDTNLSKWNIWTGGAFNNELQLYQAGNLQVTNGNLVITARKET